MAAVLRAAGVLGQLEELPAGVDTPPGPAVRAAGFECDGRSIVVLVPAERAIDRDKLAIAGGCTTLRPAPFSAFPFEPARVFLEHSLLTADTVWLAAGTPRHVLGLAPGQLVRITRAQSADLLLEDEKGEVDRRGQG